MNKDKIQSIEIKKFRGATKLTKLSFDPKKKMVMIFGENGSGKSTIVDAIDFIFNKKCGSVRERSSVKIPAHVPSLGFKPRDVEISVTSNNLKNWKGNLDGVKPQVFGKEDKNLSVEILRRGQVLKLVNAEPQKRYETLKNFIGLSNIRSSEKSLKDVLKDIEEDINKNVSINSTQIRTLEESWEKEGKPEEGYFKWAEKESKKKSSELIEKNQNYEKYINLIEDFLNAWKGFKNSKEQVYSSKIALDKAKKELQNKAQVSLPEEIIDILKNTLSFLNKKETKECPACEQIIDSELLKKKINVRLENMKELKVSKEKCNKIQTQYESAQKSNSGSHKLFTTLIQKIDEFKNSDKLIEDIKKELDSHKFLFEEQVDLKKEQDFFKKLDVPVQCLKNTLDKNTKSLNQLNLIQTSFNNLKKTKTELQKLNKKKEYLKQIFDIIRGHRKSYVDNSLVNISQDVEDLYLKLHPRKGLGNIKLYLKSKGSGSLEMTSNFQTAKDVPPQAYFSDSHLDTLGICIFIAMAKHDNIKIIVLDDVLTSADQQNMDGFIKMLHDVSKYFNQVILTTHYKPWREQYKFYRHPNSDLELIELHFKWSIDQGIKSSKTKLSIKELEDIRDTIPFDAQGASSKTGVFIESLLDHLTLLYQLRLPRKPNPIYTLREFIDCFPEKVIKKLEIEMCDNKKEPLFDTMKRLFQIAEPIRNKAGCHWNEIGQHFSEHEILDFLNTAIEFGKKLICSECKGLPVKERDNSWQCSCKKTRLYPLKIK